MERSTSFNSAKVVRQLEKSSLGRTRKQLVAFGGAMRTSTATFRSNARISRQLWGALSRTCFKSLRELTQKHCLSIASGDLQLLDGRWYVTHSGLLQLAARRGCCGIDTNLQEHSSDPAAARWVFRAVVYKSPTSKGFVGYGDADPSNVSSLVRC
jgi:hypothetical protein